MDDSKQIVESLKKKVARIIDDNRSLRQEVGRLNENYAKAVQEKRACEETIHRLNRRIEALEISRGLAGNHEDQRVARLRVNKLLREIDKCLALMNK